MRKNSKTQVNSLGLKHFHPKLSQGVEMKCNKNTFRLRMIRAPSASLQYHHSQLPCVGEALQTQARVGIFALQLTSCVTLGLLHSLSLSFPAGEMRI